MHTNLSSRCISTSFSSIFGDFLCEVNHGGGVTKSHSLILWNRFYAFPSSFVHFSLKTWLFLFCFSLSFYPAFLPWFNSIRFASPRHQYFLIWRFHFSSSLCLDICVSIFPYLGIEKHKISFPVSATPDCHRYQFWVLNCSRFSLFYLCPIGAFSMPVRPMACHLDHTQRTLNFFVRVPGIRRLTSESRGSLQIFVKTLKCIFCIFSYYKFRWSFYTFGTAVPDFSYFPD